MEKTTKQYIEEFLAKGGKITKCEPGPMPQRKVTMNSTSAGPAKIMSLQEGDLYYGEKITRAKKRKTVDLTDINMDIIPDELRKKLGI